MRPDLSDDSPAALRRGALSRSPVRPWIRSVGCTLAVLAACSACAPAEAKDAASPAGAPPPELLVSVALGPVTTLRNLQAYVEAIKPGAGASLSDQVVRRGLADAVGASSLDGLDPTSGLYLLIADTGGSPGIALLGKVSDARKLEASAGKDRLVARGGWAVIGPRPLIDRVAPYGIAAIAPQPAPRAPTATVYVPHLLARYKTEIEAARTKMTADLSKMSPGGASKLLTAYVDGLWSLASDTERVVVSLEAAPDLASLDIALVPRAGSRLAAFTQLQRASNFALLGRLPQTTPTVLLGGHLELGPFHDAMVSAIASLYIPEAPQDLIAAFDLLRKVMTGEIATTMQFGLKTGMEFTQIYTVTDARAADKAFVTMLDMFKAGRKIDMQTVSFTLKASPSTTSHGGVTLRSYDTAFDLSKLPPEQHQAMASMMPEGTQHVYLGAFDDLAVLVSAKDGAAEVRRTIDAARGKGAHFAAGKLVDPLLAASRARKDSLVMAMDLGGLMGSFTGKSLGTQPIVMAFGAADRNAHLRFSVPAATARALASLGSMNGGQP
ncbi:MAG TPA: hypothetical protein VFK02_02670 [Kofleriaceae bacterium]|nr:hypothetical protein [Kofleriaceae bacterium]